MTRSSSRLPFAVRTKALPGLYRLTSDRACRLRISSSEKACARLGAWIYRHQRRSRSISKSRLLNSMVCVPPVFLRTAETALAPVPAQARFRRSQKRRFPFTRWVGAEVGFLRGSGLIRSPQSLADPEFLRLRTHRFFRIAAERDRRFSYSLQPMAPRRGMPALSATYGRNLRRFPAGRD